MAIKIAKVDIFTILINNEDEILLKYVKRLAVISIEEELNAVESGK